MAGYAVVDVETTGLWPAKHDRIAEIAVVALDDSAEIVESFETLVNPQRDLGPQVIHGISAADIRRAPTFAEVACHLIDLLNGRVIVAHNVAFDMLFLEAEFSRIGVTLPVDRHNCLCTMRLARNYLSCSRRTLEQCCQAAEVSLLDAHTALGDALAAGQLLRAYVAVAGAPPPWWDLVATAQSVTWPNLPRSNTPPLPRDAAAAIRRDRGHFLARVALGCDSVEESATDAYLEVLDRVLLDRLISDTEADHLVELAAQLSLDRRSLELAHHRYLQALAAAAWEDLVITPSERQDLLGVASLLGLPDSAVDDALRSTEPGLPSGGATPAAIDRFVLRPGDIVVLTGEMTVPREVWERRIEEHRLVCGSGVTKKTALLVAADPDSLSGKARKANDYGIPIVTEQAFADMLAHFYVGASLPIADERPPG